MIKVTDLKKHFGRIKAVDGISFAIGKGETFGLLGPNGAGKTTTINMIVGLLRPESGNININGHDDPTRADIRMQLGNAPQSLAIYDELTAEENLVFFGRLYKLSRRKLKKQVDWAMEFAGLTDRKKHRVGTFSGGMKRRLNLACALVHDPPVLLLDEPTVGVDPQSRNLIYESIEELGKAGRTILYTTHYMEEASRLCHRVAIIDHGKILALDTVEGLIDRHGGMSIIEAEVAGNATGLPGIMEDNRLCIETEKPMEQFSELIRKGVKFSKINIKRADLETVFLNLTGRRLRD